MIQFHGNFSCDVLEYEDLKCIELDFKCSKGSMNIKNAYINDKKIALEYVMMPTELINKIKDALNVTDSFSSRMIYLKDGFKIWNLSLKNRLIGAGGEAFKNNYQLVQENLYTSTEVHNSFMQILVESGIIGGICIFSILVIYFVKSKKDVYTYALAILVIHSFIDLDFSYMLVLCVFAILLGIEEYSNEKNIFKLEKLRFVEITFFIILSIISFSLVSKMTFAYYMKVPKYEENAKAEILASEKRVLLDSTENNYRETLSESYNNYLNLLKDDYDNKSEEIIQILEKSEENAFKMKENNLVDKENLKNISDIYFFNLEYILSLDIYEKEKQSEKINEYITNISENLEFIKEEYKYNERAKEILKECLDKYQDVLLNLKESNNFDILILDNMLN